MIVINRDVVWGIAQPLYVYVPYAMYSFICICEYRRAEGRTIYEMVVLADPSAALASSNNPMFFIHPQILRSTCHTLASSFSRSMPQHARDSRNAESRLSIPALCTLMLSSNLSESTGELIGSWLETGMNLQSGWGREREVLGPQHGCRPRYVSPFDTRTLASY